MNERLKELERQCWQSTQSTPYALFDVKKFAQLIVRECVKIADLADEKECEWIGGDILTHFGAEE